jgi:hypothetical protein
MASEPHSTLAPSACAGLRRALLHDGQAAFPIEPSPFHALMQRYGGSAREVLLHCQALQAEGAIRGLRTRWRPGLAGASARLVVHGAALPAQPPAAVRALPGAMAWTAVEAPSAGPLPGWWPTGWVDLSALDAASLNPQIDAAQAALPAPGGVPWSTAPAVPAASSGAVAGAEGRASCRCGQGEGPCRSRSLAAACERGLPVIAHPYRAVGRELGLSERAVVQSLRRWRTAGQLEGVGFAEPVPSGAVLEWHAAYDRAALVPALRDAIAGHATVERLVSAPGQPVAAAPGLAALALLVAPGGATAARLADQLVRAGLGRGLLGVVKAQRVVLRHEPLLFSAAGTPAAAGAVGTA